MQNKNKNLENDNISLKKQVSYSIKTMDSDLKKEGSRTGSFDLSNTPTEKDIKTKKEVLPQAIQPLNKRIKKSNFNPFLDDIKTDLENPLSSSNSSKKSKAFTENNQKETTDNSIKDSSLNTTEKFKKPIAKTEITDSNYLKNRSNKSLEKNQEKSSFSFFLILFLISLFLVSVGSGVYYFYFFNQENPPENPIANVENNNSNEEKPVKNKTEIPIKLKNSQEIIFNLKENTNLKTELTNKKDALTELDQCYMITNSQKVLSSIELLTLLDIQFSEIFLNELNKNWLCLSKNQENILKMSLIFELNNPEITKNYLLNNEYRLLQILEPMFIDEVFVLEDEEVFFKDSQTLNNVRYYNLIEGFDNKAIDWKILNNQYLLITTSEASMKNLISYLTFSNQPSDAN